MSMALSLARPVCFPLLGLFGWVQRTALLGFLSLSGSLHICSYWSVSFCCQVCLGKFYFPKVACHFCLWRNFMSSPHLIHLTILFSSDSGLLLCPQVTFFNIKVHHPWLPRLKGVGKRQTNSTFLKAAWSLKTLRNKRCMSRYKDHLTTYLLKGTERNSPVLLFFMEKTTLFLPMPNTIFWVWQGSSLRNEVTLYVCIQMLPLLNAL